VLCSPNQFDWGLDLPQKRKKHPRLPRPANQVVQLKVRLLEELRRRLEREAVHNGHSMNTEIVERLQRSFQIHDDQIDTIARSLMSDLDPRVIERIIELVGEDERAMAYDWHEDQYDREGK
jgi:Arc-like DNA binding domain